MIPPIYRPAIFATAGTLAAVVALLLAGHAAPTPAAACAPHTQAVNDACAIIVEATATAAPAVAPIDGLFDYRDPATHTQVDPASIACIDGSSSAAPGMVLVAVGACSDDAPHAWVREADVPQAVGVRSVADLAPAPTAVPATEYRPALPAPAQQAVEYAPPPALAAEPQNFAAAPTACVPNGGCYPANAPEVVYVAAPPIVEASPVHDAGLPAKLPPHLQPIHDGETEHAQYAAEREDERAALNSADAGPGSNGP